MRRRLRGLVGGELGHRLVAAKKRRCPNEARERLQAGVIGPDRLDIIAPRDGDAVLGAFELRLQGEKILIRFQIGIIFADREETPERAGQLRLGILELLELVGIAQLRCVDFDRSRLGPRLDDGSQHILFLLGITLHGGDQIGNEVGPPLILILHVAPFGLGLLLERGDRVVAAA